MKSILFIFSFFSFLLGLACDCDVSSFIKEIANADLSIRGTVIEETEVSYSYRNLKLPLKVKVKIEEKYYGIELRDTIEIMASKSWSGFYGLSLQKGENVLLNLYFGEKGYVFPSHCCSINSLVVESDSVETGWQGKFHYKDYEKKILNVYGPFHKKVNQIRYGDLRYMEIKPVSYQEWNFVLKSNLPDGMYWVYDIEKGQIITREYIIFHHNAIRKIKKYYSNKQVALEQFFSKQQFLRRQNIIKMDNEKVEKNFKMDI